MPVLRIRGGADFCEVERLAAEIRGHTSTPRSSIKSESSRLIPDCIVGTRIRVGSASADTLAPAATVTCFA